MNTVTTTAEPVAPKHRHRIPKMVDSQLLDYTRQLLDRYGAGNLPIVERELSAKLEELMQDMKACLQPIKTPKAVQPESKPRINNRRKQDSAMQPVFLTAHTGRHPP